ncbi:MAG: hypothetical protein AVDCRST_MAG10-309 [uncultured Acidimicrobiales bacterium]|uniref:Uncharacterized protein n=1 Tax=uncultured Acidimicrobiales bacterium TaxID=310071 RepID=A0A6J4H4X9_9ACTN|nr:MAG: hypothetical protein AVDCRST_MAG10-309 [uncultured Acidimicrobiales bacterium]
MQPWRRGSASAVTGMHRSNRNGRDVVHVHPSLPPSGLQDR